MVLAQRKVLSTMRQPTVKEKFVMMNCALGLQEDVRALYEKVNGDTLGTMGVNLQILTKIHRDLMEGVEYSVERYSRSSSKEDHLARLIDRFMELSMRNQIDISHAFGILIDDLYDGEEVYDRILQTAKQEGSLGKLWDEIESRHANRACFNPFQNNPLDSADDWILASTSFAEMHSRCLTALARGKVDIPKAVELRKTWTEIAARGLRSDFNKSNQEDED